jgi:hypothetical protein
VPQDDSNYPLDFNLTWVENLSFFEVLKLSYLMNTSDNQPVPAIPIKHGHSKYSLTIVWQLERASARHYAPRLAEKGI